MSLLEQIAAAGVIGCGGAGFPTHVKLKGRFEVLIVNGAECEPLLRNDRWMMRHKAEKIIAAMDAVISELAIPRAVIALKAHYEEEIEALKEAVRKAASPVEIHTLESFYPAGDEQTLVYEVTGRVVPPGGLPSEVGAVVCNVATMYSVGLAVKGYPFIYKYLTVTGEVRHPAILCVPVGTDIASCIELAGGAKRDTYTIVLGGPMMGRPLAQSAAGNTPVTKTTSWILVLPAGAAYAATSAADIRTMLRRARSACIQCTTCTQLCPRHLLGHPLRPHRIMRKMAGGADIKELLNDPDIRNAQICCECGICEAYACPMGLQPRRINAELKKELAAAGIRYERRESVWVPHEEREERKAPSERVAARAGVHAYYDIEIDELVYGNPSRVMIPLKMSAGAPSVPTVTAGTKVKEGDLIAAIPEGKLGSNIHASIRGTVTEVSDRIVIEKE